MHVTCTTLVNIKFMHILLVFSVHIRQFVVNILFWWKSISHQRVYDKLTKIQNKTSAHFIREFFYTRYRLQTNISLKAFTPLITKIE